MSTQIDSEFGPVGLDEIVLAANAMDRWHIDPDPTKRFRSFDGRTPLSQHSILCAMLIGVESELPAAIRYLGQNVLLLHDVEEDTRCGLPDGIHPTVSRLVKQMTFPGGTRDEFVQIWSREKIVWLFKLYDKYANLSDGALKGGWMWSREEPETYIRRYLDFTLELLKRVEQEVLPDFAGTGREITLHVALNIRSLAAHLEIESQ